MGPAESNLQPRTLVFKTKRWPFPNWRSDFTNFSFRPKDNPFRKTFPPSSSLLLFVSFHFFWIVSTIFLPSYEVFLMYCLTVDYCVCVCEWDREKEKEKERKNKQTFQSKQRERDANQSGAAKILLRKTLFHYWNGFWVWLVLETQILCLIYLTNNLFIKIITSINCSFISSISKYEQFLDAVLLRLKIITKIKNLL